MATIALLGSRPLARKCLTHLHKNQDISIEVVVTYPKEHDGWWDGSLHEYAKELGYPVETDENSLSDYDIDYLISVLYFNIIDKEILDMANICGINLHQAELPRYRGSNSFSHAIINARKDGYWKYGTTLHIMTEELDAGDIIDRSFVEITEDDTARSLYEKTETASLNLFKSKIERIAAGTVQEDATPQSRYSGPRYYYSSDSLEGEKFIEIESLGKNNGEVIYDKIRALDFPPFKPAFTRINGQEIHLTRNSYEQARKYL